MRKCVLFRLFNWHTLAVFLISYMVFCFSTNTSFMLRDILGGISVQVSGEVNLMEILRWNLCVLPPVAMSSIFACSEAGAVCRFTMYRSKSIGRWYSDRILPVVILNYFYCLAFILFICLWNWGGGLERVFVEQIIAVFPMHTTLLSVVSFLLIIRYGSVKLSVIVYFLIDGLMVVVGSLFPPACKFLLPFWGMAANKIWLFSNQTQHVFITVSVTLSLILVVVYITQKWLHTSNPASSSTIF